MNLTIKPLTPELAADYFDFFENRAFTDDSPYRCYCQVYQMSKAEYQTAYDNIGETDVGLASRKVAEQQIAAGVLRGYLTYVDGVSIGWCNAGDRANYPAEPQYDVPFYAPAEKREKAVVCFEIAPEYRGKGIATALLQQVITDAREEGYIAVEGYPIIRDERYEWDCAGPTRLYEKQGFAETERMDNRIVMRKTLEQSVENDIVEALTGEAQAIALDFAAFLHESGMAFERGTGYWSDKRYWMAKYKNEYVCFVLFNGYGAVRHKDEPEGWCTRRTWMSLNSRAEMPPNRRKRCPYSAGAKSGRVGARPQW